jgi:hypothetical protein
VSSWIVSGVQLDKSRFRFLFYVLGAGRKECQVKMRDEKFIRRGGRKTKNGKVITISIIRGIDAVVIVVAEFFFLKSVSAKNHIFDS